MQNSDGLTSEEKIKILSKGEYLILATVDCDGESCGVPLNYIVKDNYDVLCNKKKINFNAVGNTRVLPNKFGTLCESIMVSGDASLVDDEKEKLRAFREFFQKNYSAFSTEFDEFFDIILSKTIVMRISVNNQAGDKK